MMRHLIWLFIFLMHPSWAIQCYYTLVKDNCWLNYDVNVDVFDADTSKPLTRVVVPKGQAWSRVAFPCHANGQKLIYQAQFSPVFWENDKNKVFSAKDYWLLPNTVNPGDSAWNVPVCFSKDFAEVPMPPEATGACVCDFKSVPEIEPKIL